MKRGRVRFALVLPISLSLCGRRAGCPPPVSPTAAAPQPLPLSSGTVRPIPAAPLIRPQGSPEIAGCSVFPADNIWNTPIDALPVDPNSDLYIATIGADKPVHPDFGSGQWPPGSDSPIGIPYVDVPGTQPKVAVTFLYADESDAGPYPLPSNAPIEGGLNSDDDRHTLVLDRDNCLRTGRFSSPRLN